MTKLSSTGAELKNSVAYENKTCVTLRLGKCKVSNRSFYQEERHESSVSKFKSFAVTKRWSRTKLVQATYFEKSVPQKSSVKSKIGSVIDSLKQLSLLQA